MLKFKIIGSLPKSSQTCNLVVNSFMVDHTSVLSGSAWMAITTWCDGNP